jgi:ParB family chromosome partitioning protein
MEKYDIKPSLSQATRLKKMKQADELTLDKIDEVLSETKKPPKSESGELKDPMRFSKYFPSDYSLKQMEDVIASLLKDWQKEQKRA